MQQEKIDRINELARKAREVGLTEAEAQEQQALRQEYIAAFRRNLADQLDHTVIVDQNGKRIKPMRKSVTDKEIQ